MQSRTVAGDREALREALVGVVAEHGWRGATVGRVSRAAGVEPERFYDCYRSLEQCYLAAYDRMMTRVVRTAIRAVASRDLELGPRAWQRQLDAILGAVLAFFALEPALARTCLVEVHAVGPAARARRDAALGTYASYLEGLRLSHGEPLRPLAAEMIALGTAELIRARVARGDTDGLPDLLPELRQLWDAPVATASSAARRMAA